MEKPSLCRNMKQMHDFKFKVSSFDYGSGDYNANLGDGDLVAAGFSWPPRSYICSFCKREFRSAQALGGHMNVHRRDRARLRQSPTRDGGNHSSSLNLNLEPNPSSYSSPSSTPSLLPSSPPPPPVSSLFTKFPQFTSKLPPPTAEMKRDAAAVPSCRPIITTDFMKVKAAKGVLGVDRFDSSSRKKRFEGFKKQGFVQLDLEIGVITPSEEELDLELRLGYT